MKNRVMTFVFIFLTLVLLLSGCGSQSAAIEPSRASPGEKLVREHFLYDLNNLEYILENNLGLLDVAYWNKGYDLRGMIDEMRDIVANSPASFDQDDFFDLLTSTMRTADSPLDYIASNDDSGFSLPFAHFSIRFPNESIDAATIQHASGRQIAPELIQLFDDKEELFELFLQYYFIAPCANSFMQRFFAQHFADTQPLSSVAILKEGYIGYLSVSAFPGFADMFHGFLDDDINQIAAFLNEVRNYKHLIIDLRGNGGGDYMYFIDNIVRPLINEPKYAYAFYFSIHKKIYRKY